jgi:hypothetical protein
MYIYILNASPSSSCRSTTLDCLPVFNFFWRLPLPLRSLVDNFTMAIENRGPQVEAVAITFLILSWIAVSLRCYVKLFMTKLFRIDDWLAVISLV